MFPEWEDVRPTRLLDTKPNLHEVRGARSAQPLTWLSSCSVWRHTLHLPEALIAPTDNVEGISPRQNIHYFSFSFPSSFFQPGDVVVQESADDITLYHEGFFWRCSFGGSMDDDDLLWKLWFSKWDRHMMLCCSNPSLSDWNNLLFSPELVPFSVLWS